MIITAAIVLLLVCPNQTTGCCGNTISTTIQSKTMTIEQEICPNCKKNACDMSCSSKSANKTLNDGKRLKELMPSCSLNEQQMNDRKDELTEKYGFFDKVEKVIELKDGYDFVFVQPKEFSQELLSFINFERNCCSNFSFALEFEPKGKATHLKIYGSKAIKEEVKKGFVQKWK